MKISIYKGGLSKPDVQDLLKAHVQDARENSPMDSSHALDLDALRVPDISFWHYRDGGELVGFCALKHTGGTTAEIKSMRTVTTRQRQGIGSFILGHIIDTARARGISILELETGANTAFAPARALYNKFGFSDCAPIKGYKPHPFSHFMRLELKPIKAV